MLRKRFVLKAKIQIKIKIKMENTKSFDIKITCEINRSILDDDSV